MHATTHEMPTYRGLTVTVHRMVFSCLETSLAISNEAVMSNKKSIADMLLEKAPSLPPRGQTNRNIAQFLACKEGIEDALSKGWNMKSIWQLLHERNEFLGHYNCFTIYVKRFIRSENIGLSGECNAPSSTQETTLGVASQVESKSAKPSLPRGFHHDPVPPKPEQLFG